MKARPAGLIARSIYVGLALALIAPCPGCAVAMPLPVLGGKPAHGRKLEPAEVAFIRPGVTTRAEVVERLGNDFRQPAGVPALAYSWSMRGGGGVWFITSGEASASGNWLGGWRAFFIAYDQQGVVTLTAFRKLSYRQSLDEHVRDWLAERTVTKR